MPTPSLHQRLLAWSATWLVAGPAAAVLLAGVAPSALQAQATEPEVRVLLLEAGLVPMAARQQPLVLRAASQRWELAPGELVVLQLAAGGLVLERGGAVERLPQVSELWLEPAARPDGDGADFQLQQRGLAEGLRFHS